MRKISTVVAALLIAAATFAQAPQGFSYQAVVRDAQNAIVANQTVEVNVTILQGANLESAKAVFTEKHSAKTNANGLFTLTVGSVDAAGFAKIDWGKGSCFLKTESAYGENTTQLMSVPYALYADKAASIDAAQLAQILNGVDMQAVLNFVNKTEINTTLSNYATTESVNTALANYTTAAHLDDTLAVYAKIEDLPEGVNLTGYAKTEDLADVATSGSYNDLTDKPVNVSTFNNDANYLVASDIAGKADKSEMSITNGTGTATIQLKSGTSATVLTQHQSIANNSTIQELQEQVAALQTALAQVYTTNVKVKVTYHNPTVSGYWQYNMSDLIRYNTLIIEGHSFTSEQSEYTFSIPIYQDGLEWHFDLGDDVAYGFCTIKVNGVQLTLDDSPLTTWGEIYLTRSTKYNTVVYQNQNTSGDIAGYFKEYEIAKTTNKPGVLSSKPSGFTNDNILFRFLPQKVSGQMRNGYEYKPIPAKKLFSAGKNNVVEIDVYGWYGNAAK
ncbi:MAG: hypothetical protein IKW77_06115 [Salinivirgaceae bacterium]|nr:hypothetical protein [Salinivirgaceae bacterium]